MNTLPTVSILPAPDEWKTMRSMAEVLVDSTFLPQGIKSPEQALAIMTKGRELGIGPWQSISHIALIQGKPTCTSELQLALLARGGVTWEFEKDGSDLEEAVVHFYRPDFKKTVTGRFSMVDAERAGLKTKDSWKRYPANMLRARAISNGARMVGPDLLAGMSYTHEEMGALVNEDEELVEPPPPPVRERTMTEEQAKQGILDTLLKQARHMARGDESQVAVIEDYEEEERKALIAAILTLERELSLVGKHIHNARVKYAGASEEGNFMLDHCGIDGLNAYLQRLNEYASQQMETTVTG